MQLPVQRLALKAFFTTLLVGLFSFMAFAQTDQGNGGSENSTTTTTTTKKSTSTTPGDWYTSPWVWVVGAAVFILLLVALLSNRGRDTVASDRVRVTKTVERDRGSDA